MKTTKASLKRIKKHCQGQDALSCQKKCVLKGRRLCMVRNDVYCSFGLLSNPENWTDEDMDNILKFIQYGRV